MNRKIKTLWVVSIIVGIVLTLISLHDTAQRYGILRLSEFNAPWLGSIRTSQIPKWELLDVVYVPPNQSDGNVNIYVTALDADGTPAVGQTVWLDTGVPADRSFQITKAGGAADFPQTGDSSFDPNRGEHGPYSVFIGGLASDWATGMGLPLRQHVMYLLKFRKKTAGATPTWTPVSPFITPTLTPISGCEYSRLLNVRICPP